MASKKDKFKKAASDQLKRKTGGESGGMSELVRNIEQDKQGIQKERPQDQVEEKVVEQAETPAPEIPPVPDKSSAPPTAPPTAPPDEPAAEGDVYESAMVVEVDSGEGNISLSGKDHPVESGPQQEDPAMKRGQGITSASIKASAEASASDYSTRRAETKGMAKSRESIYNVSSDIRLEDYTESQSEGGGFGGIAKIGAGLIILLLLAWGVQSLVGLFFAPEYILAVSSAPITDASIAQAAQAKTVAPGHGGSVFVRFQWNEGELETDLVRIVAEKKVGGTFREVASKSRTLPETVTYIYFQNSFTPGQYRIQVTARNGKLLAEREIFIR